MTVSYQMGVSAGTKVSVG